VVSGHCGGPQTAAHPLLVLADDSLLKLRPRFHAPSQRNSTSSSYLQLSPVPTGSAVVAERLKGLEVRGEWDRPHPPQSSTATLENRQQSQLLFITSLKPFPANVPAADPASGLNPGRSPDGGHFCHSPIPAPSNLGSRPSSPSADAMYLLNLIRSPAPYNHLSQLFMREPSKSSNSSNGNTEIGHVPVCRFSSANIDMQPPLPNLL